MQFLLRDPVFDKIRTSSGNIRTSNLNDTLVVQLPTFGSVYSFVSTRVEVTINDPWTLLEGRLPDSIAVSYTEEMRHALIELSTHDTMPEVNIQLYIYGSACLMSNFKILVSKTTDFDTAVISICADVYIGIRCVLEPGCFIKRDAYIGHDVHLGHNVHIGTSSTIGAYSMLEDNVNILFNGDIPIMTRVPKDTEIRFLRGFTISSGGAGDIKSIVVFESGISFNGNYLTHAGLTWMLQDAEASTQAFVMVNDTEEHKMKIPTGVLKHWLMTIDENEDENEEPELPIDFSMRGPTFNRDSLLDFQTAVENPPSRILFADEIYEEAPVGNEVPDQVEDSS